MKPSSLASIFKSLSTLTIRDLPEVVPALVPDLKDLRRDLAIRRGQDPPLDQLDEKDEHENEDGVVKDTPNESGSSVEIEKETIYMGIVTTDSTVVYYKLTKGIKKPADIPDE